MIVGDLSEMMLICGWGGCGWAFTSSWPLLLLFRRTCIQMAMTHIPRLTKAAATITPANTSGDNPNPGTVDFNLEEVSRPAMLSTTCSALNDLVMAPFNSLKLSKAPGV